MFNLDIYFKLLIHMLKIILINYFDRLKHIKKIKKSEKSLNL